MRHGRRQGICKGVRDEEKDRRFVGFNFHMQALCKGTPKRQVKKLPWKPGREHWGKRILPLACYGSQDSRTEAATPKHREERNAVVAQRFFASVAMSISLGAVHLFELLGI